MLFASFDTFWTERNPNLVVYTNKYNLGTSEPHLHFTHAINLICADMQKFNWALSRYQLYLITRVKCHANKFIEKIIRFE